MQGIKNFYAEGATEMKGTDPDFSQRDLIESIEQGNFPKWRVCVQIMPEAEAATYKFNPFDLTKVWSHKDYPLIEIGIMELNRNPANYFAEVEQSAFSPANIVPGMGYSPDKMLQGRLLSYGDAHRYRLGVNYETLPVNRPQCPVHNYHRDGQSRFDDIGGIGPNYEPNSFGGPAQDPQYTELPMKISGDAARYDHREGNDDYTQAGDLYRLLPPDQKARLIANLAGSMKGVPERIIRLQISHFAKADAECGRRLAEAVGLK
jgi:catalase